MIRYRSTLVAGAVLVLATLGTAKADGLQKFETVLKPTIPPGTLSYGNAISVGENGFILKDVKIDQPAQPGQPAAKPVTIKVITVEDFDFDAVTKKVPPGFGRLKFEGINVGPGVIPFDFKPFIGTDTLNADFALDFKSDTVKETFILNRLELKLDGLARLELGLALDGVTPEGAVTKPNSKDKAVLRSANLTLEDRSLLAKLVPVLASMQQLPPEAAVAMANAAVNSERATLPPEALPPLDALSAFISDYQAPKGPLTITLNPPNKLDFDALGKAAAASGVVKVLGLKVDYSGTRPWVAPATPAAPSAPAPTPAPATAAATPTPTPTPAVPAGCATGTRYFVMDGDAYKSATAREASASGARCILKLDSDGKEVISESAALLSWTIDGPGKASSACTKGDKVIAESDGAWFMAMVKGPAKGGSCGVHYDGYDESEDDDLPLAKIRVLNK